MKKTNLVVLLIVILIMANTSLVGAMSQAEIDQGTTSLAYVMQVHEGKIKGLNLEGELGFSSNFGVETILTYANEDEYYVDVNAKVGIVDDYDYNVSALVGYNTDFEDGYPRIGILYSRRQTKYLDLNIGCDVLLENGNFPDYLGYMLGFDYSLTRNLYVEIGHRKFSGQKGTEGLGVGMKYYF